MDVGPPLPDLGGDGLMCWLFRHAVDLQCCRVHVENLVVLARLGALPECGEAIWLALRFGGRGGNRAPRAAAPCGFAVWRISGAGGLLSSSGVARPASSAGPQEQCDQELPAWPLRELQRVLQVI